MTRILKCTLPFIVAVLLAFAGMAAGQTQSSTTIKKTPVQQTPADSGAEMYKSYCAVCHGVSGKGDGPAAAQLKQAPPDLTTLAKRHDGKYPDAYVVSVLRFGAKTPSHGTKDMPIWGPLLFSVSSNDKGITEMRIANLTAYLKTLQAK